MKTSQAGTDLIKKYEGCRLTAYKCPAGVWTIGYGHTENVRKGMTITQEQAECFLRSDLIKYEVKVSKYDKYGWRQNEFDALVSFAYNIGSIDQLTAGGTRSRAQIAEKIIRYDKAGGKALAGLTKRRKEEQALFLGSSGTSAGSGQIESESGIVTYSRGADGEKCISKNFKVKEFRCKDGSDKILVDVDFVRDKLQNIRDHFGTAVTINSAYRTPAYNKKVGGAAKSYHCKGQAFDIVVKGHTPVEVARYAQRIGIPGIGLYNGFTHVDSRKVQYLFDKRGSREIKVNSF